VHVIGLEARRVEASEPNLLRFRCAALEAFVETLAATAIRSLGLECASHSAPPPEVIQKYVGPFQKRRIQGTLNELLKKLIRLKRRNSHPHTARYVSKNAKENLDAPR